MNGDPSVSINLTELGKEQAKKAAQELQIIPIDIIFTSEFPRAIQTAEIINTNNIPIKVDKRINEIKTGMEGEHYKDYVNKKASLAKEKNISRREVKINDGESFNELKTRVKNFIDELKTKKYKSVTIVTHYDTLIGIDETINDKESTLRPKNGEIIKFAI